MENGTTSVIKKIIRASAGTGKTYRLSLEYIGLLLKFRQAGIHFSEILVITFTKKATAEIRENIFTHLQDIIHETKKGRELQRNLHLLLDVDLSADDRVWLKSVYESMVTNKHLVRISTIDSFTHTIFKSMISPYLGLTNFDIVTRNDPELLPELYRQLIANREQWEPVKQFFQSVGQRRIDDYNRFMLALLENRWIFHLIDKTDPGKAMTTDTKALWKSYLNEVLRFLDLFIHYVREKHANKTIADVLRSDLYREMRNPEEENLSQMLTNRLTDESFVREHYNILLVDRNFWNGTKLLRRKEEQTIKQELSCAYSAWQERLADYLYATLAVEEQNAIMRIADTIFRHYDSVKFRSKQFTYGDISYYTFANLYHPDLSLVVDGVISNGFYEQLASAIRFVLIDEFQDTSIVQLKILLPIIREVISGEGVKPYGGTIIVGDEKQSIYGWRGGERDLLLNMPRILYEADELRLNTSYRSDKQVIDFVNELFGHASLHEMLGRQGIEWPYDPIDGHRTEKAGYVGIRMQSFSRSKKSDAELKSESEAIRSLVEKTIVPLVRAGQLNLSQTAILARKNATLMTIAAMLEENGIPCMREETLSIIHHRAIRPLLMLCRFLVYHDFYDLLCYVRSDAVLAMPEHVRELIEVRKRIPENTFAWLPYLEQVKHIPGIQAIIDIMSHPEVDLADMPGSFPPSRMLGFLKKLVEKLNIIYIFDRESDIKNLHFFLEKVAMFDTGALNYPGTLKGLLDYCYDYEKDESFLQVGLEETRAIKLMSIHKSKGLEFETVFVYWNLGSGSSHKHNTLHLYMRYSDSFEMIPEAALTYSHQSLLKFSHRKALVSRQRIRENIEQLNTLYVALTRAKSNLFFHVTMESAGGIVRGLEAKNDKDELPGDVMLVSALMNMIERLPTVEMDLHT